jgi:hypothetical protein
MAAAREAFVSGMHATALLGAVVAVALGLAALRILDRGPGEAPAEESEPEPVDFAPNLAEAVD